MRSVNHVASRARRKKTMKQAKGYWGRRKNVWTVAKNAIEKGMQYAYRDRKAKKRDVWEQSTEAKKVAERWDKARRSGGKTSFSETSD